MRAEDALNLAKSYVKKTLAGMGALKGKDGYSPKINENSANTDTVYKLDVQNENSKFTTPNLRGENGNDGFTPTIKEDSSNSDTSYKLEITNSDGTFSTPNLIGKQGIQGMQGIQGIQGAQGEKGEKGDKGEKGEQGIQGIQGIKGDKGDDGYPFLIYKEYTDVSKFNADDFPEIGLMFMVKTWEEGKGYPVYRYTGDSTGTPYSLVVHMNTEGIKGEKGDKGDQGEQGVQGEKGESGTDGKNGQDGTTYTPSIGTVTTVGSTSNASATVAIDTDTKQAVFNFSLPRGEKGQDGMNGKDGANGVDGADGKDGVDGITPHIDETTKHWFVGYDDTGVVAEGQDGTDGISPTVKVTKSGKVATITCTDKNGTTTQTISDGEKGDTGGEYVRYSTSERVVGQWIDGKPLYQKTIKCKTPTRAFDFYVASSIPNMKYAEVYGGSIEVSPKSYVPLNFGYVENSSPTKQTMFATYPSGGNLYMVTNNSAYCSLDAYVTIRYTKTTD